MDFEFRYDCALGKRIRSYCGKRQVPLQLLAARAFRFTSKTHNVRQIIFDCASGFRRRRNKIDKETVVFTHSAHQREAVRNFAFSYRISMAEVYRISIEMYLDAQEVRSGETDTIKHYCTVKQSILIQVTIPLFPAYPYKKPVEYYYTDN